MKSELKNGILGLTLPGDLLSTTVDTLRTEIRHQLAEPPPPADAPHTICLDLRASRLIDSAGVNLLVGMIRTCQAKALKLKVLVASRTVHRTLLFTRLDRHLELVLVE
jgi:anti-anti-sigma factor